MTFLLSLLPWLRWLVGWLIRAVLTFATSMLSAWSNLIILFIMLACVFTYSFHGGRVKERGIWEARIAEERRLQNIVTTMQDAAAAKDLQELEDERNLLDGQVAILMDEAAKDGNASRMCLGPSSQLRINKGRKGKP